MIFFFTEIQLWYLVWTLYRKLSSVRLACQFSYNDWLYTWHIIFSDNGINMKCWIFADSFLHEGLSPPKLHHSLFFWDNELTSAPQNRDSTMGLALSSCCATKFLSTINWGYPEHRGNPEHFFRKSYLGLYMLLLLQMEVNLVWEWFYNNFSSSITSAACRNPIMTFWINAQSFLYVQSNPSLR